MRASRLSREAGLIIDPNTANGSEPASGTGSFNLVPGSVIYLPNVSPTASTASSSRGVLYGDQHPGLAGSITGTDLQASTATCPGTTPWAAISMPHRPALECGRALPHRNASTRLPARSTGSVTSLAT